MLSVCKKKKLKIENGGSSWIEFLQHFKAICAWMQAFILLIKKGKKASKIARHHLHERGGSKKKTAKQLTTKTQTKPPVLIKHRVDSNPAKWEKAPDLMREGEEQNWPRCFLQSSCQTIPQEFLHLAFGSKKKNQMLCRAGILFYSWPLIVFQICQRLRHWGPGSGSQVMGWRGFSEIWFILNKDNDPSLLKMSCAFKPLPSKH